MNDKASDNTSSALPHINQNDNTYELKLILLNLFSNSNEKKANLRDMSFADIILLNETIMSLYLTLNSFINASVSNFKNKSKSLSVIVSKSFKDNLMLEEKLKYAKTDSMYVIILCFMAFNCCYYKFIDFKLLIVVTLSISFCIIRIFSNYLKLNSTFINRLEAVILFFIIKYNIILLIKSYIFTFLVFVIIIPYYDRYIETHNKKLYILLNYSHYLLITLLFTIEDNLNLNLICLFFTILKLFEKGNKLIVRAEVGFECISSSLQLEDQVIIKNNQSIGNHMLIDYTNYAFIRAVIATNNIMSSPSHEESLNYKIIETNSYYKSLCTTTVQNKDSLILLNKLFYITTTEKSSHSISSINNQPPTHKDKLLATKAFNTPSKSRKNSILLNSKNSQQNILAIIQNHIQISSSNQNTYTYLGEYMTNDEDPKYFDAYINYFSTETSCENQSNVEFQLHLFNNTALHKRINMIQTQIKDKEMSLAHNIHEFKTPLNAVIMISENLENSSTNNLSNNDTKNQLTIAKNISHYTSFLVTDFTQATKRLNNDITIHKSDIVLSEILEFCSRIQQVLIQFYSKDKNNIVRSELIISEDIQYVVISTDEVRIKQVLLNFISNSVKFTKLGLISIKAFSKDNSIIIEITDTGIGMNSELLDNINKMNFQDIKIDQAINKSGSGYGISIALQILNKIGYNYVIESQEGKGTTIRITIPFNNNNLKKSGTSKKKQKAEKASRSNSLKKSLSSKFNSKSSELLIPKVRQSSCSQLTNKLKLASFSKQEKNYFSVQQPKHKLNSFELLLVKSVLKESVNRKYQYLSFASKNNSEFKLKSIIENESNHNKSSSNNSSDQDTELVIPEFNVDHILKYLTYEKDKDNNNGLIQNTINASSASRTPAKINNIRSASSVSFVKDCYPIDQSNKKKSSKLKIIKKLSINKFNSMDKSSESKNDMFMLSKKMTSLKNIRRTLSVDNELRKQFEYPGVVLIADDLLMNLSNLSKRLDNIKKEVGGSFEIKTVSDGISVLSTIIEDNIYSRQEGKVKLLLCDNFMEFVNGYTVVQMLLEFKSKGKIQDLPYMVCTTAASEEEQEELLEVGFDEIANKALSKKEILNFLKKGNLLE